MTKPRAGSAEALENFLSRFRNLAHAARASKPTKSTSKKVFTFMHGRLGGMSLRGRAADLFDECLTLLLLVHAKGEDGHLLSKREAGMLLRSSLLDAREPAGQVTTGSDFETRLQRVIATLRATLTAEPREWGVALRVAGLASHALPFVFGTVKFSKGTDAAKRVAARLPRAIRGAEPTAESLAAERRGDTQVRKEIRAAFAKDAVAETQVLAVDAAAARDIAIVRTRRVVDALNFFTPFFEKGPPQGPILIAPDGPRLALPYAAWVAAERLFQFSEDDQDTLWPAAPQMAGRRAKEIGLVRAHELLLSNASTDLDKRVLNALSWAGRATVEPRPDQSFLMYTVAMEALLGKHEARSRVTARLARRVVGLISNVPEQRIALKDQISDLYRRRSAIVHAGDTSQLTRTDLDALAFYCEQCIVKVLTDETYLPMRSAHQLMALLDDRSADL